MRRYIVIVISLIVLSGCQKDKAIATELLVYQNSGARQCEPGSGMSPEDSAVKLTDGGVEVVETVCGNLTGVYFPAACGMGTGAILIHKIADVHLSDAEKAGFKSVSELVDDVQGIGYEIVTCGNS